MKRKIVPPIRYDPVSGRVDQSGVMGSPSKKRSDDVMAELSSFYNSEDDEYEPVDEEYDEMDHQTGVIHRRLFGFASPPVDSWPDKERWESSGVVKYVEAKDEDGLRYVTVTMKGRMTIVAFRNFLRRMKVKFLFVESYFLGVVDKRSPVSKAFKDRKNTLSQWSLYKVGHYKDISGAVNVNLSDDVVRPAVVLGATSFVESQMDEVESRLLEEAARVEAEDEALGRIMGSPEVSMDVPDEPGCDLQQEQGDAVSFDGSVQSAVGGKDDEIKLIMEAKEIEIKRIMEAKEIEIRRIVEIKDEEIKRLQLFFTASVAEKDACIARKDRQIEVLKGAVI